MRSFKDTIHYGIEVLDTCLQNINNDDNTLAVIGNNKYGTGFTNIHLARLCIRELLVLKLQINAIKYLMQ